MLTLLLIKPRGTNLSEIWIKIHTFTFEKKEMYFKMLCEKYLSFSLDIFLKKQQMHNFEMSLAKCLPFSLGLNVLLKDILWTN